ncbi:hypothetical protein [Nocardiopsis aegyptia]|uniref:HTH-type transcriptional repressor Sco4008 C-terminal domain-containing protein n=1 Tax=Nocardiopsis aegyptia TaxID=220378 RepID=A0A7Z0JA81_9ACTN|nr:hypothetical protein [Nocardiopsis aegyptia]NYJ35028.1 hypothetical protein [Nocardiopsis aegyptia]
MLRDELVKVARAVPVESFATEDVGEYAGRVYDYHCRHPELSRLLRWEGRVFDAEHAQRRASVVAAAHRLARPESPDVHPGDRP